MIFGLPVHSKSGQDITVYNKSSNDISLTILREKRKVQIMVEFGDKRRYKTAPGDYSERQFFVFNYNGGKIEVLPKLPRVMNIIVDDQAIYNTDEESNK